MSRKKRLAPNPPTDNVMMEDNSPPITTSSIMEEDLERTSSTSSPTSHDSGIEEGKPRSRDSSTSNSRNSLASSTLDLEDDLIPTAPPIDASLLEIIPLRVYESRTNQILNAKGTLKKKQSTDLQFFLHEHEETVSDVDSVSLVSEEDFGGIKGHIKNGHMTIRSHRGTVRGVRNRVRAGIATFLRDPTTKNYGERESGHVVMYITTLSILRETWARCVKVRQILRNLLIKVDERDVFMSRENQTELMERMGTCGLQLPQVFVDGQYLGDADAIEKMNECGELRQILRPFKNANAVTSICGKCGGFRMLPCPTCAGSKKSMHRNDFTEQFIALRCTTCDECGLVKCDEC